MTYHAQNIGMQPHRNLTDLDGFGHTTIKEWLCARVDWAYHKPTKKERIDHARQAARLCRQEVKIHQEHLAMHRRN